MADYLRQTKANIEEHMTEEVDMESENEEDTFQPNFIIDNFKAANSNTFNVILAQRENDIKRITALCVKVVQLKAEIDKIDSQKYQLALDNTNLKIEIEDGKKALVKAVEDKTLIHMTQMVKTRAQMNLVVLCNIAIVFAIMCYRLSNMFLYNHYGPE